MATPRKRKRRKESLIPLLVSLLFLFTAVYGLVRYIVRAPEPVTTSPVEEEPTETPIDTQTAPQGRKEYCYTILLNGLDDGNGGSDTNILMRFDATNDTIDLVSLPRDTLLHHDWISNKLNYCYAKGGMDLLRSEISNLLGVPVDFYVTVNLKGFEALVDELDGVDFDVPVDMNYDDPVQDLHIHFNKGYQHLDGADALRVVRWRKNNDGVGYATADIGRIGTQQAFLKAVAKKLLQPANLSKINSLVNIFNTYVKTDLSTGNMVWLGTEAINMGLDKIQFHTLPGDGAGWYSGESVYALDAAATLELVNTALNPYTEPLQAADLDILVP